MAKNKTITVTIMMRLDGGALLPIGIAKGQLVQELVNPQVIDVSGERFEITPVNEGGNLIDYYIIVKRDE